jgi:septal ring factor EnvC (AmiA/AmiB activator)
VRLFSRPIFQILFLAISLIEPTIADSKSDYQAKLKQIQQRVDAIQKSISAQQTRRGKEIGELKNSEKEIASIVKHMRNTSKQSQQAQRELEILTSRSNDLSLALENHRQSLYLQLKTAYQTGRTPRIQLLLSQRDPALISRMFNYYNYFNQARQKEIDQALTLLSELAEVRQKQSQVTTRLHRSHKVLQAQHATMQQAREKRRATIVKLETALSAEGSKLSHLLQDQRDLEQLLDQLNQLFADIPPPPLERKPFHSMKKKLPWPTPGTLKARYNSLKGIANLRWKGMFISAEMGNNVHAIHHGQVAFADWMNGFGLILIIDHGEGYMSIYANNQELRKSQGEWVAAGEVIATVGNSGGQSKSGVYFEIRQNGRPINPHSWVKKSIKSVSIQ